MEKSVVTPYKELSAAEATSQYKALFDAAATAIGNAYAPFSGFRVVATALLDNGEIVAATNQESEVFPSGMCAERCLLYAVQQRFPQRKIKTLLIASDPNTQVCTPCGACRQVLWDSEKRQGEKIEIVMTGGHKAIVVESTAELLPFAFSLPK